MKALILLFSSRQHRSWRNSNYKTFKIQWFLWWNEHILVDKQNELKSDLLFTIHQHGGDNVTLKPPIASYHSS